MAAVDVVIPKMGMTMQEGTLVEWLVADGASVSVGDPLFVLNTDKLDAEIEAEAAGFVHHIAEPGVTLPVGAVIATIATTNGASPTPAPPAAPTEASSPNRERLVASPNARRLSRELGVDLAQLAGSGAGGRIVGVDVERAAASFDISSAGQSPKASVAARRLATSLGLDLAQVAPSTEGREITRHDVERAAARALEGRSSVAAPAPAATTTSESMPLVGMRRVIAERMHSSLQAMAQLTIGMEARADRLVDVREQLKATWPADGRAVPTYADLVALAAARALPEHRALNAVVHDDHIERLAAVHIGMAVALDDGLVVPVVRDVDRRTLSDFAATSAALVTRARAGQLSVNDLSGATFSVTSLGGAGVDFFTPVINPPNVAILGIGRIRPGSRLTKKGRVKPCQVLTLSLTFDHRAVDGLPAATFLRAVCDLLEDPLRLLR